MTLNLCMIQSGIVLKSDDILFLKVKGYKIQMKERDIMMKNVIFYSAKTQYQNLGDMIINREMLLQLRPYGKLIVDDKGVPEWFCKDLEINSDERSSNHGISFENLIIWYAFNYTA